MRTNLELAPPVTKLRHRVRTGRITVVLADEHDAMRRTLRRLLDADDGITVVAEASDLDTAIRHVRQDQPHVLILHLHLQNGSPITSIRWFRRQAPVTQIVALAMEVSPAFATEALDAGALGYVLKEQADRDLLAAVHCAAAGERYVASELAATIG